MGQPGTQSGLDGGGVSHGHGGGASTLLFTTIDHNHDGQLSMAELRADAAVLKALDKYGDGQLSKAEFAAAEGEVMVTAGARQPQGRCGFQAEDVDGIRSERRRSADKGRFPRAIAKLHCLS